MAQRYLFVCPDASGATGGVAVIYACVETLRAAGHDAVVLHETPGFRYAGSPFQPPVYYSRQMPRLRAAYDGWREKLSYAAYELRHSVRKRDGHLSSLEPTDILVVPEYLVADVAEAFPHQPKIIFSQNPFSYLRSFATAQERGFDPDARVIHNLAVSRACEDATRLVSRIPCSRVAVCPNLSLFGFREEKKRQIVFMPRKRPAEARLIASALAGRGRIADFELVSIDGMSQAEVAERMSESLIFISLMREEGLGFPGIEAMSAGCMVIGYTGFAGAEYFDDTTGIPVTEGDTVGIVRAVEATVARYLSDPSGIDAIRKHASGVVRSRYNEERFTRTLLQAWQDIEGARDLPQSKAGRG